MTGKDKIIYLYFTKHIKQSDIANKLNISRPYITKIIKLSDNYFDEKEKRKQESHTRHSEQTKKIMRKKRAAIKEEEKAVLAAMHLQASLELSYSHPISNISLRKSCSSAYNYKSKKKIFELDKKHTYSIDMPKIIKY